MFASADADIKDSVRADSLYEWLQQKEEKIADVVADLCVLPINENGEDIRQKYSQTGLGANCSFHQVDLTQQSKIPQNSYDLILCWEFIHVFHETEKEELGTILDVII